MGFQSFRICHLLAICLGILGSSFAQDEIVFSCDGDWTLIGTRCYKAFSVGMRWNDAVRTCHAYGSSLVRTFGFTEHQMVADLAASEETPIDQYWIGLSKEDGGGPDSFTWANIRGRQPIPASTSQGYWYVNQPDLDDGNCVMVQQDGSYYYGGGWRVANCLTPLPFVCESRAGLQGSYRCANGRFIQNTEDFICDGEDDCGDYSDEIDCSSECRTLIETGDAVSGTLSTGIQYSADSDCLWTIEAPAGSRVSIQFTRFTTEPGADWVQIWVGGKTERSSTLISQLSGDLDIENIPTFHSTNNFLLVKFHSDSTTQMTGISFTWTTESQYNAGSPTELEATETLQTLASPDFETSVKTNQRERWIIRVPTARRVISLQVSEFDLPECGTVQVYDGEDFTSPLLDTLSSDDYSQQVVSTGNTLSVSYQTCGEFDGGHMDYKGFQLTYRIGCGGEVHANQGHVFSPGYMAGVNYPNYQQCTWLIKSPTGDKIKAIFRDDFDLENGVDFLMIYDAEAGSGIASSNLTGVSLPEPVVSQDGHLFLSLTTNSIINGQGFYLEFSTDCPELGFNNKTIVEPSDYSRELDAQVSVTCPLGYVFAQESHEDAEEVMLTCEDGEWNVAQTPQCERIWCGQAPAIDNGYYRNATGSQFEDTVTYACYAGFKTEGLATITCSDDGNWTSPPECVGSQCEPLADLMNGDLEVVVGEGGVTDYGSIVEFTCDQGYELVGVPRLYCNGEWSEEAPSCTPLPCPIEVMAVHFPNGQLNPSANVTFGESVSVLCDSGFVLESSTTRERSMDIECLENQTFNARPRCVDDNECDSNNGGCDDMCTNTIGSYVCSCSDGFKQNDSNSKACIDIDECAEGGVGFTFCQDQANCQNTIGSYICGCSDGKTLYTDTSEDSYFISFPLEGEKVLTALYINHSCIFLQCPMPSVPVNGDILTTSSVFEKGDTVSYACDLGYQPTGVMEINCLASGQWDIDPDTITCQEATCELPDLSSLTYPPADFDGVTGNVPFGANVIANCLQHRPDALQVTKWCQYDISSNSYQLYLNESSVECPIIDCGEPTLPQNSMISIMHTSTTYNSTFQIACQENYEPDGNTTLDGNLAFCGADGKWDFGSFECYGVACDDPGTNPGTIQVPYGTYEPDNVVGYACIRDGFTLDQTDNLTCTISMGQTTWDGDAPSCSDTTGPVIHQDENYCGSNIEVDYLSPPGFTLPTVTDNTGSTQLTGLMLNLDSLTNSDGLLVALAEYTLYQYKATDYADNTVNCDIGVRIKDRHVPTITCPASYTYYLDGGVPIFLELPEVNKAATSTDTLSYSPSQRLVSVSDIGVPLLVEVTATDTAGNSASCTYMISLEASECSSIVLDDPHNGETTCQETAAGFNCSMTCNEGYYFYEESGSGQLVNNLEFSCTTGAGGFNIDKMPDCVSVTQSDFYVTYKLEFDKGDDSSTCLEVYSDDIARQLPAVATFIQDECQGESSLPSLQVEYVDEPIELTFSGGKISGTVSFRISPNDLTDSDYNFCVASVTPDFTYLKSGVALNLQTIMSSSATCTHLVAYEEYFQLVDNNPDDGSTNGDFQCEVVGAKRVDVTDAHVCLPCPPGHYYDSTLMVCSVCPLGQYQDGESATGCMPCGDGTYTYTTGSRRQEDCVNTCAAYPGFVSQDGNNLPPCAQCAVSLYSNYTLDSNTCASCPVNTITNGVGASSETDCMSQCVAGEYSTTGFEPCTPCPLHFYNEQVGFTECMPCDLDKVTLSTGTNKSALCLGQGAESGICIGDECKNNGTCSVQDHHIMCTCEAGYTGPRCETMIDYCSSSPCYAGDCVPQLGGFECVCPTDEYSGDLCEVDPENCDLDSCENAGMCFDQEDSYMCLCPLGYSGDSCQDTANVCDDDQNPCGSHGDCRPITNRRRVCDCQDGWTGEDCDVNINECDSNPCLYGFACTDGDNGYTCECGDDNDPDQLFSGDNCENRISQCSIDRCGDTGQCYDDYRTNSYLCICNQGYERTSLGELIDPWYSEVTAISVNSRCDAIDFCDPRDPCINGTCENSLEGAVCNCVDGFTGSRCQRNIDECADNPCEHGECVDGINQYTCECEAGFTGKDCETDIDNCDPNMCNVTGTDQSQASDGCHDLVDDFRCVCKPGYDGKTCGINRDDCLSSPCLHGGECEDEVDDYTCHCPHGWEGKRCHQIASACNTSDCQHDAQCHTVFGAYICDCSYPYFGEFCEEQASTCLYANPCVNDLMSCEEDDTGVAMCTCSEDFSGDGCQMAVDFCAEEGFCEHGGECESTLDGYTCACEMDFFGNRCQESVDDCSTITCENGGICEDGVGQYLCRCPIGSEGPDCERNTDTDWDLYFYGSEGTGMAYTPYPFELGEDWSIAFWVKSAEEDGQGVILTLYAVEDEYLQSPKMPLLQVDELGVTVTFSEGQMTSELFGNYDINDGRWHFLTVTWSEESALLQVMVDSVRVIQLQMEADIEADVAFILLGAPLDDPFDSDLEPRRRSSFQGHISHVYVWDIALDFSSEIPHLADNRNNLVRTSDLVLDWSAMLYQVQNNVHILPSSTAGDVTCDAGVTGDNCDEALPDKESPTVEYCPDDVHFTVADDKRFTSMTWNEPEFEGSSETRAIIESSRILTPGWYPNAYVAYDSAHNTAVCTFDIYVRSEDCQQPTTPGGVTQQCTDDQWPFRTCTPSCTDDDSEFTVEIPDFFTCGPEGSFNVFQPSVPLEFPECAAVTTRTVDVRIDVEYPNIQNCDRLQNLDSFGIPVRDHLEALDMIWKIPTESNTDPIVGAFCMGQPCEAVITVETTCVDSEPSSKRRKRAIQDTHLTISIQGMADPIINVETSETRSVEEVLLSDILDDNGLTFSEAIPNADPSEASLVVLVLDSCPVGSALMESGCVECAAGTYYNSESLACVECPVGHYQDMTGQMACTECQNNKTTQGKGSKRMDQCFDVCEAGSELNTDSGTCELCERGYYQPEEGRFFCHPCQADKTTAGTGSVAEEDCYGYCGNGTELADDGVCKSCEIGYYRTAPDMDNCEMCSNGKVTPSEGSDSEADCTVPNCLAGTWIVEDGCEPCPVGTYQPDPYQTECEICEENTTTLNTSSQMSDDCKYFCPLGAEELIPRECEVCEVGFYKNNSLPGEMCEPCPPNLQTEGTGSTSQDNCTVLVCVPGTHANDIKTMCVPCERGTYQPEPNKETCEPCEEGQSTRVEGADSESFCEKFCAAGTQAAGDSSCEECPRGYYRDLAEMGEFSRCQICPDADFITNTTGATSVTECRVSNCSSGTFLNEQNVCENCSLGFYQPDKWQSVCIECEGQRTTDSEGAMSQQECKLDCEVGFEDAGNGDCEKCARGYYKQVTGTDECTECEEGFTTANTGATSEEDCSIAACLPGSYRNSTNNTCVTCPRGTFEDREWQEDGCQLCNSSKTTLSDGAVSGDACVENCEDGKGYDEDSGTCVVCQVGYYRTQGEHDLCEKCPEVTVTATTGALTEQDCNLGNCTAGSYRDGLECFACPRGQYQPDKWMDSCLNCSAGQTTLTTGSQQKADCYDIPPPITLVFTIRLDLPFLEAYKDRTLSETQDLVAQIIAAVLTHMAQVTSYNSGSLSLESLSQGSIVVLLSGLFDDTMTAGVGGNLTSEAELLGVIQSVIDSGSLAEDLPTDTTFQVQAIDVINIEFCDQGEEVDLTTGHCVECARNFYQPDTGLTTCLQCPTDYITKSTGTHMETGCYHPDNCMREVSLCPDADAGERCDMTTERCVCRPGWTGSHPNCTHKCDTEEYCKNGGMCEGEGTDVVTCDCSDTNYEGEFCQTRKDLTSYTTAIIGGAIGGGLGLFLIIMLIAACCCGCRKRSEAPVYGEKTFSMPLYGQSAMAYNTTPHTGVIVHPGSLYAGGVGTAQTLPVLAPADSRQSLPGYVGTSGMSTFMYHDDMAENQRFQSL